MSQIYFDFKDDVTVKEIAEILQNGAFRAGIRDDAFNNLSATTQRNFIFKPHKGTCPRCGANTDINNICLLKEYDDCNN